MNARPVLAFLLAAALGGAAGWFAARNAAAGHAADSTPPGADNPAERKIKYYQSPMHPWIISDQPGKCTICGMALAPVYEGEAGFGAGGDSVTLTEASYAVVGVATAEVRRAPLLRTLRVTGVIDDDETRHRYIASYTDARIEKLFVHTTGETVAAGRPLALLYSPELLTARQEFHALARTAPDSPLAAAAREKLRRLGLLDTQIDALAAADSVERDTEILAPLGGTVVARAESAYEGGYVRAGETLFTLGDFGKMWFVFDAHEPDLPFLREGQPVTVELTSRPGATFTAPITFIDPNLDATTRTARVRVVLDNPDGALRHRQTALGRVTIESEDSPLLAPRSALLHTRAEPLVYVERGDRTYAPRTVRVGRVGDEFAEILSGLSAGERVVTQGALLLDGQAQLAAPAGPTAPAAADTANAATGAHDHEHAAIPATAAAETPAAPLPSALLFAAADASAVLAADDLAGYARLLPALVAAVHGAPPAAHEALMPLAAKLVPGPDLKTARDAFEPFSTALADLVRAQPTEARGGLRIFQCPMTPVLGTGRWLQRDAALRNPFYGSEMLECGEELP